MSNKDRNIEDVFKSYFDDNKGYRGGKSGDPNKFDKIHKLSSNENPLGCSPQVQQVIKDRHNAISGYPDATDLKLREAIAELYDGKLKLNQLICGNGGSEVIDWIIKGSLGLVIMLSSLHHSSFLTDHLACGLEQRLSMCHSNQKLTQSMLTEY